MTPFSLDWPEFNAPFSLDAHDSKKADSRHTGHQTAPFTSCIYRGCKEACWVYKKKQDEEGGWIRKTERKRDAVGNKANTDAQKKKNKAEKDEKYGDVQIWMFYSHRDGNVAQRRLRPNRSLVTPDVCVFSQLNAYVFVRVRWIEIFSILMLFYILGSEE